MDAPRTAFAFLSQPDEDRQYDGLITMGKLQAACRRLEVLNVSNHQYSS